MVPNRDYQLLPTVPWAMMLQARTIVVSHHHYIDGNKPRLFCTTDIVVVDYSPILNCVVSYHPLLQMCMCHTTVFFLKFIAPNQQ